MTLQKLASVLIFQLMLVHFVLDLTNAQPLNVGFYQNSCPSAEEIIKQTTASYISQAPTLAAPLLRMHFHDCFVRGCDGSVLLNSMPNNQAEKDSPANIGLRGYQVIDDAKSALENKCPGVVSCADILALVARDAVSIINGPSWPVPTGRRDGRVSMASDIGNNNLPGPFFNINQLKSIFSSKGLSTKDLVVLSGAHTIGTSHCTSFSNRLYNFTGKGDTDPTMDPNYIAELRVNCKAGDTTTIVEMDPGSFKTFDEDYYTLVSKRRGLFESDAALLNDDETKAYVNLQVASYGASFFDDFGLSMVKMGQIGVLTGTAGEIRRQCGFVN